jgi:hypothetical protein
VLDGLEGEATETVGDASRAGMAEGMGDQRKTRRESISTPGVIGELASLSEV